VNAEAIYRTHHSQGPIVYIVFLPSLFVEGEQDLPVDAATQQLIQSVLSEGDEATATELETVSQQCHRLHGQIEQLN